MESGAEGYFEMKIKFKNEIITQNKNDNNKPIIREKHLKITKNEFSTKRTKNSQNEHNKPQNEKNQHKKQQNHITPIEKHRTFMEEIFLELSLNSIDDFLHIKRHSLKKRAGSSFLIDPNKNQYKKLLISIFPNYPFDFAENNSNNNSLIQNEDLKFAKGMEKQRKLMEKIFIKGKLKSMDDWINISAKKMIRNGGEKLLEYYEGNMKKLLLNIFPNFPWEEEYSNDNINFKSIEKQREFMDKLFIKFKLNSLDEWLNILKERIKDEKGFNLLRKYKFDFKKVLLSIYPNYPWLSLSFNPHPYHKFKSIENQQKFMDKLFKKFNLNSFDDWKNISRKKLIENGGERLILKYYNRNLKLLFATIYPNYPWKFSSNFRSKKERLNLLYHKIMEKLFIKLNLKKLDDWMNIPIEKFIRKGGGIVAKEFNEDMKLILSSLYPFFPWNHVNKSIKKNDINNNNININSQNNSLIENQFEIMEKLFIIFNLKSFDDWINIPKIRFIANGGKNLLKEYKNDLNLLFTTIYPNYPWKESNLFNVNRKKENYQSIENQRKLMEKLFIKLKLKSINDWIFISKNKFRLIGGKTLLILYKNMKNILLSIYPNHQWNFELFNLNDLDKKKYYFKSIKNQQIFMDNLFTKLNLNSLEEWFSISQKNFINNGGEKLIEEYKNDMKKLLLNIYPNFPWNLINNKLNYLNEIDYFKSIENQRNYMDNLFKNLNLNTLNDFVNISNIFYQQKEGNYLLSYYKDNFNSLLSTIYPNFPWNLRNVKKRIENYRKLMDQIYILFNLQSLDDWIHLPRAKIMNENGGRRMLEKYNNDKKQLLIAIYPYYPWDFTNDKFIYLKNSKIIQKHRKIMDNLFIQFNLKSIDDWLTIKRDLIVKYDGNIMKNYRSVEFLLKAVYPDHHWDYLSNLKTYFKLIENQRKFMDDLFIKFKLKSLDDWLNVERRKIFRAGGRGLLVGIYNRSLSKLLETIYPNFPWNFAPILGYFKSIENQIQFMEELYKKLNLNSFDDWIYMKRSIIRNNGGNNLLHHYYNGDKKVLFRTIYPNFPWNFPKFELKEIIYYKLKSFIHLFNINQKKDWYRVPRSQIYGKYSLYRALKTIYSSVKWSKTKFFQRSKKSSQRLLFSFTQKIFPNILVIEDYYHPKLTNKNLGLYELDIFIPTLYIAMEYQGAHHYDDIPSGFSALELFQSRDLLKEQLAISNSIKIIYIPYWWDATLPSLLSTICSEFKI